MRLRFNNVDYFVEHHESSARLSCRTYIVPPALPCLLDSDVFSLAVHKAALEDTDAANHDFSLPELVSRSKGQVLLETFLPRRLDCQDCNVILPATLPAWLHEDVEEDSARVVKELDITIFQDSVEGCRPSHLLEEVKFSSLPDSPPPGGILDCFKLSPEVPYKETRMQAFTFKSFVLSQADVLPDELLESLHIVELQDPVVFTPFCHKDSDPVSLLLGHFLAEADSCLASVLGVESLAQAGAHALAKHLVTEIPVEEARRFCAPESVFLSSKDKQSFGNGPSFTCPELPILLTPTGSNFTFQSLVGVGLSPDFALPPDPSLMNPETSFLGLVAQMLVPPGLEQGPFPYLSVPFLDNPDGDKVASLSSMAMCLANLQQPGEPEPCDMPAANLDWHYLLGSSSCDDRTCFLARGRVEDAAEHQLRRARQILLHSSCLPFLCSPTSTVLASRSETLEELDSCARITGACKRALSSANHLHGSSPSSLSLNEQEKSGSACDLDFFLQGRTTVSSLKRTPRLAAGNERAPEEPGNKTLISQEVFTDPSREESQSHRQESVEIKAVHIPFHFEDVLRAIEEGYRKCQEVLRGALLCLPEFSLKDENLTLLRSALVSVTVKLELQPFLAEAYALQLCGHFLVHFGVRTAHTFLEIWAGSVPSGAQTSCKARRLLEKLDARVQNGDMLDHPKLLALEDIISKDRKLAVEGGEKHYIIVSEPVSFFTMFTTLEKLGLRPYHVDREGELLSDSAVDLTAKHSIEECWKIADCLLASPRLLASIATPTERATVVFYTESSFAKCRESWLSENSCYLLQTKDCVQQHEGTEEEDAGVAQSAAKGTASLVVPQENHTKSLPSPSEDEAAELSKDGASNTCRKNQNPTVSTEAAVPSCDIMVEDPPISPARAAVVLNTRADGSFLRPKSLYCRLSGPSQQTVQVVERDLLAPVDLILNPSTALAIFTSSSLLQTERPSSFDVIPYVEGIVEDKLRAISLAFDSCVLVFEGTNDFVSQVMDCLDLVYGGASALDLNVQCLFSTTEQVTEYLVLACLELFKPCKALGTLPEIETLGEKFLSSFPSLNTLSAHSLLRCGKPFPVLMCLADAQQVAATAQFNVPEHSILLFWSQCHADLKAAAADEWSNSRSDCLVYAEAVNCSSPPHSRHFSAISRGPSSSPLLDAQVESMDHASHHPWNVALTEEKALPMDLFARPPWDDQQPHKSPSKFDMDSSPPVPTYLPPKEAPTSKFRDQRGAGRANVQDDFMSRETGIASEYKLPFQPGRNLEKMNVHGSSLPRFHDTSPVALDGQNAHASLRDHSTYHRPQFDQIPFSAFPPEASRSVGKKLPVRPEMNELHAGGPWQPEYDRACQQEQQVDHDVPSDYFRVFQDTSSRSQHSRCGFNGVQRAINRKRSTSTSSLQHFDKFRHTVSEGPKAKRSRQSSGSKNSIFSDNHIPFSTSTQLSESQLRGSFTPSDHRSKEVLSFAKDDSGKQSRLIWKQRSSFAE